jgi:hypothetical protein
MNVLRLAAFFVWAPLPALAAETPVLVVAREGPCADAAALEAALAARGFSRGLEDAPFRLDVVGAGALVRAVLVDRSGESLLDRTVPSDDCAAAVDTIALLVERRLEGVSWEPAAAPAPAPQPTLPARIEPARSVRRPPPRRPSRALDLGAGVVFATGFVDDEGSAGPLVETRLRALRPITIGLAVARLRHEFPVPSGRLVVDRYPLSLWAGVSRRARTLELDVGARLEVETLAARTLGITEPSHVTRASFRIGPYAAVSAALSLPAWIALYASVQTLLAGTDFVVHDLEPPHRETTVASQTFAVELGATVLWRLRL